MALSKGDLIKLTDINLKLAMRFYWVSLRDPAPDDTALVETLSGSDSRKMLQLLCESRPGLLDWRVGFYEDGLRYKMVTKATPALP